MATSKGKTPEVAPVEAPEVVKEVDESVKAESIESGVNLSEQTAEVTETVNTAVNEVVNEEQPTPPELGVVSIESEEISDEIEKTVKEESALVESIGNKLKDMGFLKEGGLIEDAFERLAAGYTATEIYINKRWAADKDALGGFMLKRGVEVQLFDGGAKLRLLNDAFVEKTIAESTFVGNLALANSAFVGMHNDTFKLNYGGDGQLQPLSAQTTPENLPGFISTLTWEEAQKFQISEADWKANQLPTEE